MILVHNFDHFVRFHEDSDVYKSMLKRKSDIRGSYITARIEVNLFFIILKAMLEVMINYLLYFLPCLLFYNTL